MDHGTGWQVTARTDDPGWLEVPPTGGAGLDEAQASAWVEGRAAELRADWGDRWRPEHDVLVPAALEHALARRTPDDALCFQLWPVRELRAAIVHVAFGALEQPLDWREVGGALSPLTLPEVGPGVQRVFREQLQVPEADGPVELLGVDLLCTDGGALLHVRLEPTLPGFASDLVPLLHAFAATIAVQGPAGPWRSTDPGDDAVAAWSSEALA